MKPKQLFLTSTLRISLLISVLCVSFSGIAQEKGSSKQANNVIPIEQKAQQSIQNQVEDELAELTEAEQAEQRKDEAIKQLREIQISLGVKQTERKKIAATIKSAMIPISS